MRTPGWRGYSDWTNDDTKAIRTTTAVNTACTMVLVLTGIQLLIAGLALNARLPAVPVLADVMLYIRYRAAPHARAIRGSWVAGRVHSREQLYHCQGLADAKDGGPFKKSAPSL